MTIKICDCDECLHQEWCELEKPSHFEFCDEYQPTNQLTPEEFEHLMGEINSGDEESDHISADNLMCALLIQLGYRKGVKKFIDIGKWYS